MRRGASTLVVVLLLVAASLSHVATAEAAPGLPMGFELVDYPTGQGDFNLTDFAWLPDGGLLTAGKDGTVTFVPPGGSPRVIGQVPNVRAVGDHGMLGFAPANDYATTGNVFITFDQGEVPGTGTGTGVGMIEEWRAAPADDPQTFTRVRTLVDGSTMNPVFTQTTTNHGLDSVVVAADGTLFVSVGDDSKNNGGPETLRAQDVTLPYGKILHLTPDGDGVPSNPFYQAGAPHSWQSMVYAYGLRNPFRFAIDTRNNLLQLGDVGWRTWEEVDSVKKSMNGGWPCYEGLDRTVLASYQQCADLYKSGTATSPIVTYSHNGVSSSITGGAFYKGTSYPTAYRGAWFYGDYGRGLLWTLTTDSNGKLVRAPEKDGFGTSVGGPVSFHPGPNGDITFADITTSTVRRLVYTSANRAPVPHIDYTADPSTRTLDFSAAASSDPDGDAITYAWTFGDGATSTEKAPNHTYADDAARTVTLTVKDSHGNSGTATVVVHPANHPPQLTLTTPPVDASFAVGDDVQLSATATDAEDGSLPVHWQTALRHCPSAESCHLHPGATSTGPTYTEEFPDHTFDTTMLVTAKVTDSSGAVTTATYEAKPRLHTVTITGPVLAGINGVVATSAQAVEGSEVQLDAPDPSTFHTFHSWSDGGAAAHSITMPAHDVNLSLVYGTFVSDRYDELGGATSFLGTAKTVEYNTSGGGRAREFTGGRLYWAPGADRAYYLTGRVLTTYLGQGGPAKFGMPTTDNTPVAGGEYALLSGSRAIFHKSSKTVAYPLWGAIFKRYKTVGYQASCLGFPTGAQTKTSTGFRQPFEHGTITYTSATKKTTDHCTS